MNAPRPPPASNLRPTAEGAGKALREALPAEDDGLGSVGEEAFSSLIDQADRDEANHKTLMKFTPWWREFIREVDREDIAAMREMINAHKQRKALRAFWVKTWKWAVPTAVAAYGYAQGFFDRVGPWVTKLAKLIAETPPS